MTLFWMNLKYEAKIQIFNFLQLQKYAAKILILDKIDKKPCAMTYQNCQFLVFFIHFINLQLKSKSWTFKFLDKIDNLHTTSFKIINFCCLLWKVHTFTYSIRKLRTWIVAIWLKNNLRTQEQVLWVARKGGVLLSWFSNIVGIPIKFSIEFWYFY